ncbi:MAG: DUF3791 domain-containing protein [Oscillospiraceae bacterium]|nr:DUF3791 domain-containing protein [Oscillospiraceae bacterium]
MELSNHSESVRAMWLVKCIKYTAEELNKHIIDTAELLNEHGLVEWALNGYGSFHTQGYEYMGELLSGTLREQQGA